MSRLARSPVKNSKYNQTQINQISSVSVLLDHFLKDHIKSNTKTFFDKIKIHNQKKKKYGNFIAILIASI